MRVGKKPEKLLTIAEVADLCGVHEQTVYRWTRTGEMKVLRLGARRRWLRVTESELVRWQENHQCAA